MDPVSFALIVDRNISQSLGEIPLDLFLAVSSPHERFPSSR